MTLLSDEKTGLGNYFVANYPPFSIWKPDQVAAAMAALATPPRPGTPLGLYLHIPFCRKRCKFCYFRVYTDKNARDVETYVEALLKEVELYSRQPIVGGRPLKYVYFGGGTPSYLSSTQLRCLTTRMQEFIPWTGAEEGTFECQPGTLQQHKLETLKELGVTRLSLGIENFNDKILEANGRAHLSAEIHRAYGWARDLHFDQLNIDLIAGMVANLFWHPLTPGHRAGTQRHDLPDGRVQHSFLEGTACARPDEPVSRRSPTGRRHAWCTP